MAIPYYKVLMTTRERKDEYGTITDITKDVELREYIKSNGISTMKIEVDEGDYTVGIFAIGALSLTAVNSDGRFCDEANWRSIFPYSRDLTKIDVIYVDANGTEYTRFKGLIIDDDTKEDLLKNEVKFTVQSQQGILRKANINVGSIRQGMTFKQAITSILNQPIITNILNFSESNINPKINLTIDNADFFFGISAYRGLNALLQASNSVLLIDNSDNLIVRSRQANSNAPFGFYNGNDYYGRENIIKLQNYNTGLQRAFNTVKVNDFVYIDDKFVQRYNGKQKSISFDFMTDRDKCLTIAKDIVEEFKVPKYELELTVQTEFVKNIQIFDLCSVDLSPRIAGYKGADIPLYDNAEYGVAKYPSEFGNLSLPEGVGFKVTAIREQPSNKTTQIRLRQIGNNYGDGFL